MSSRPRAYRRGRAQSTLHHLTLLPYCVLPPVNFFFTIPRKNVAVHVTRTLERSVIYCVACFLSSYLLASEQMQRAPRHICSSTKLHGWQLKHGEKSYSENRRKASWCSESVKKFTRVYNAFYISRKSYALEKYFQYVSRKFRMKRYLLFFFFFFR